MLVTADGCCGELKEENKGDLSIYVFFETEMKDCSVHVLFSQWWMHWEHLTTSSPWSSSYSSPDVCHLKEVLRSAQHGRHSRLSAGLACTHLKSFSTCICSRKLRACPLLQALLRTRFCRHTLKWSVFSSCGFLRLLLSPQHLPWPTSVVLQGHFSRISLNGAQRSSGHNQKGCVSLRLVGTKAQLHSLSPTSKSSPENLCSM